MTSPARPASRARLRASLLEMAVGYRVSQAVHAAAELGLADHLASGPKTSQELADLTACHAPSLARLLLALASLGLIAEEADGRFASTPLADLLRKDVPGSVYAEVAYHAHGVCCEPWGQLLHSVKTGEPSFERVYGVDAWRYRATHPDINDLFNAAMLTHSREEQEVVLAQSSFEGVGCTVDVGGGTGALLAAILGRHPTMHGILFDQPHVVAHAAPVLAAAGVADRCRVAGGSFLEEVPRGGDLYLLKAVLHNWADDVALQILRCCRQAMSEEAMLRLVEWIVPPGKATRGRFMDLHMLVILGGRERTEDELAALLDAAGFQMIRVNTTLSGISIVDAGPVAAHT